MPCLLSWLFLVNLLFSHGKVDRSLKKVTSGFLTVVLYIKQIRSKAKSKKKKRPFFFSKRVSADFVLTATKHSGYC